MSCPSCGHTLHQVVSTNEYRFFSCPRCGTSQRFGIFSEHTVTWVPSLVDRCREFGKLVPDTPGLADEWYRLGIRESINLPEDRP